MTKKLQRQAGQVFNEDGDVIARNRVRFSGAAELNIDGGSVANNRVVLFTDHIYDKEAIDELIAELLFLKEEWENHPVYLEQEQAEDMEEIADDERMEERHMEEIEEGERLWAPGIWQEQEPIEGEEVPGPNPFEGAANYGELVRRMRNNPRF